MDVPLFKVGLGKSELLFRLSWIIQDYFTIIILGETF